MANKAKRATRKRLAQDSAPRNANGVRVYTTEQKKLPEPIKFELDGQEYICRELSPLEISEMARLQGLAVDDPRSVAFLAEFFEMILGKDQYAVFRRRAAQFSVDEVTIMKIVQGIFQDFTDRPTGPLSDSSDTRNSTDTKSTDDYSDRAMQQLEGRPDLQVAVLRANEDREN